MTQFSENKEADTGSCSPRSRVLAKAVAIQQNAKDAANKNQHPHSATTSVTAADASPRASIQFCDPADADLDSLNGMTVSLFGSSDDGASTPTSCSSDDSQPRLASQSLPDSQSYGLWKETVAMWLVSDEFAELRSGIAHRYRSLRSARIARARAVSAYKNGSLPEFAAPVAPLSLYRGAIPEDAEVSEW